MYPEAPLQMGSDWGGGRPRHSQTQYLPPAKSRRAIHTKSTTRDKRGQTSALRTVTAYGERWGLLALDVGKTGVSKRQEGTMRNTTRRRSPESLTAAPSSSHVS